MADRLDFAEVERLPHSDDISNTVPDIAISLPQTAARQPEDASDHIVGAPDATDAENALEIAPADGGELAKEPDILRCLADDLKLAGLAGEERTGQIIYLSGTSRLFSVAAFGRVEGTVRRREEPHHAARLVLLTAGSLLPADQRQRTCADLHR